MEKRLRLWLCVWGNQLSAADFLPGLDRWNQRFSAPDYVFGETPNGYLVEQASHLSPGRSLCIADGEGRNSVWLARQGHQVSAFDFSPVAIEKAQRLASKYAVDVAFTCSSWQQFHWEEETFDNVVGVFFQFANPQERALIFTRLAASVKLGGTLLILGYGQEQLQFKTGGPDQLENLYTTQMLQDAFVNFDFLHLRSWHEDITEGEGHKGMSALVGAVLRKTV